MTEQDKWRIDLLTSAAAAHLARANALAQVEWNVSLLFWGALLTSGISFAAYASKSSPPIATYIAHHDWIILLSYALTASIFVFGFSINQARSIIEARSQYQIALNAAHAIASLEPIAHTGGKLPRLVPDNSFGKLTRNIVWKTKVLSTFLFTSGIWLLTQILAHGNISVARKIPADRINLGCAFFDCHDDNVINPGVDWPEWGSIIWLILAVGVGFIFLRRSSPHHR